MPRLKRGMTGFDSLVCRHCLATRRLLISQLPGRFPTALTAGMLMTKATTSSTGGAYDQNSVFNDCYRLPFADGRPALRRIVRAGAGHPGRDHQDGIADLRRQEFRRGRTI